jgi:hypothetical protein
MRRSGQLLLSSKRLIHLSSFTLTPRVKPQLKARAEAWWWTIGEYLLANIWALTAFLALQFRYHHLFLCGAPEFACQVPRTPAFEDYKYFGTL